MEGVLAGVIQMTFNRNVNVEEDAARKLLMEIETVKKNLDAVTARFEFENAPALVEACIYEMQALAARYRFLTREARRQGLTKSKLLSLKRAY